MTANAHKRLCTRSALIALAAVLCGPASFPAEAATARLDATDPGTSFDGLVDGFPGSRPSTGRPTSAATRSPSASGPA